jgi:hypothetical protein
MSKDGQKAMGSEGPIAKKAEIEAKCARISSVCVQERQKATGKLGAFRPQCNDDGTYYHTQCHGSVCFCVGKDGKKAGNEGHISEKSDLEAKCGSKCNMERQQTTVLGAYKPACEDSGKYHHTQCHGSVCFCVDIESGEKKANTEGPIANKADLEKTCGSKCFQEQYSAKQSGLLGAFAPRCEDNGRYYPMQCREASCFCVDRVTGGKLAGTERHISKQVEADQFCQSSNGGFNLDAISMIARAPSACEQERDDPTKEGLMGAYHPQCEESGAYKVVQCHGSACFCADPITGKGMESSVKHISEMATMEKECLTKMSRCEKDRYNAAQRPGHRGQFIAKCDEQGMYEKTQCHGSVCFCVDQVDGSKIAGTEGDIGKKAEISAACEKPACSARQEIEARPGAHKPQCSPHGYFMPVQCMESQCFCVDRVTGEKTGEEAPVDKIGDLHEKCMTECEKKRDLRVDMIAGRHGPSCNIDGSYHYVQCQEAVCGCVDERGNMMQATEKNIGFKRQLDRQCPGAPTECKDYRVALRWSKCPAECTYYKGYGEALVYCCCD